MYILIFYFTSGLLKGTKATSQIKSAQICGYKISISDVELLSGTLCTSRGGSSENKPRACPPLGCERRCRNRRTLRCAQPEGSRHVRCRGARLNWSTTVGLKEGAESSCCSCLHPSSEGGQSGQALLDHLLLRILSRHASSPHCLFEPR